MYYSSIRRVLRLAYLDNHNFFAERNFVEGLKLTPSSATLQGGPESLAEYDADHLVGAFEKHDLQPGRQGEGILRELQKKRANKRAAVANGGYHYSNYHGVTILNGFIGGHDAHSGDLEAEGAPPIAVPFGQPVPLTVDGGDLGAEGAPSDAQPDNTNRHRSLYCKLMSDEDGQVKIDFFFGSNNCRGNRRSRGGCCRMSAAERCLLSCTRVHEEGNPEDIAARTRH